MNIFLQCLLAFLSCIGFTIIFNVRGKMIFYAALGGALGTLMFQVIILAFDSELTAYFAAALAISFFSETVARIHKVPVTITLIPALIPFVPGGGIYYTMVYFIDGNTTDFLASFIHTISIAGALSFGNIAISSFFRLFYTKA